MPGTDGNRCETWERTYRAAGDGGTVRVTIRTRTGVSELSVESSRGVERFVGLTDPAEDVRAAADALAEYGAIRALGHTLAEEVYRALGRRAAEGYLSPAEQESAISAAAEVAESPCAVAEVAVNGTEPGGDAVGRLASAIADLAAAVVSGRETQATRGKRADEER